MYNFLLNQFERFASLQLLSFFSHYARRREEFSKGRVMAEYVLAPPMKIEALKLELEDSDHMRCLYFYRPTDSLLIGQELCFYSLSESNVFFKVDARSNIDGVVTQLIVSIFDSIEQMRYEVMCDHERHSKASGIFKGPSLKEVQLDFL